MPVLPQLVHKIAIFENHADIPGEHPVISNRRQEAGLAMPNSFWDGAIVACQHAFLESKSFQNGEGDEVVARGKHHRITVLNIGVDHRFSLRTGNHDIRLRVTDWCQPLFAINGFTYTVQRDLWIVEELNRAR